ncbi:MAG TPA: transporter substrate-binding domain-containing protein, partial [Myxococcota bacterium]
DRMGAASDVELAALWADALHVSVEPVRVDRYADLIPYLIDGKGDVIAARMTDTDARRKQIAFSRPAAVVSELVIGKSGDSAKSVAALAGRAVTVRPSSSYRESLDAHKIAALDALESQDEAALVRAVASTGGMLTVCDSDMFENIAAFIPGVAALFPLREGRQIAFGFRKENAKLLAAANAFLVQHALTEHARATSTGDLDDIKQRGSIRVLLRNNATSYFVYRGVQQGFDYELMKAFAQERGLRIDVMVPPNAADVIPWLLAGRADVIATEMTVTDARAQQLDFSLPYLDVNEVLVQKASDRPISKLDDLAGTTVTVRKTSSYRDTLAALAPAAIIADAPEDEETEQLIARVAHGELAATVADSTIADVENAAHKGARATLVLKKHDAIAFGVRKGNPALRQALDAFVKKRTGTAAQARLYRKYFASDRSSDAAHVDVRVTGKLSPYDELIKKQSRTYGLDWRLMASQAYEESGFDPAAQSWCGAVGLFQVMPHTGRELGFPDVTSPEHNIHAGIMYMAQLIDSWDAKLPFKQRVRFALASYNAGHGHVEDARELAQQMGLDPDRWFGNVEKAMLRLEDLSVARHTKHGYCRGSEPVKYVSDIQSRYDNWTAVLKDDGVR